MRRALALLSGAVAVTGSLVFAAGTAQAAEPGEFCTITSDNNVPGAPNHTGDRGRYDSDGHNCVYDAALNNRGGNRGGGWNGGRDNDHDLNGAWRWHDRLDGNRYIVLDGGSRLDVCDSDSYATFVNRHSTYRSRLDHLGISGRYGDLRRSCATPAPIVTNGGDCVTFTTNNRTYGDRYNTLTIDRNRALDLATRATSPGGRSITDSERRQINLHDNDRRSFRDNWTRSRDNLRTICHEDSPPVTIINEAPEPAPTTVTESAPAPAPVIINNEPRQTVQLPNVDDGVGNGDGSVSLVY